MRRAVSARAALGAYRLGTYALRPLAPLILARRRARGKEDTGRLAERYGQASTPRPDGPLVWFHAASVGESLSVLNLIDRLIATRPGLHVLITTGTVTSAALMAKRLPDGAVHQYVPLDHPAYCTAFLAHWRPDLAIWVESEFWPNLMTETDRRQVPMLLLNARLSPGSFEGWQRAPRVFADLVGRFDLCLAQDGTTAARLGALGASRVDVPGNLKLDAPPLPVDEADLDVLKTQIGDRPTWLAASTHDGEEGAAGDAHKAMAAGIPGLLTLIAPRHPGRGPRIAEALRARGLTVAERSKGDRIDPGTDVYLADTMGELGCMFRLAPVAFVGGSLVPHGGHNPVEPARLGCAVLFGPHMFNFAEPAAALLAAGGAVEVATAEALAHEAARLLADPNAARAQGDRARHAAAREAGVTARVLEIVLRHLPAARQRQPRLAADA